MTPQVFLAIEWLVDNVNPKFVLKTDDDAYVDTAHMVTALKELCQQPSCEDERCGHCLCAQELFRHAGPACKMHSWIHACDLQTPTEYRINLRLM